MASSLKRILVGSALAASLAPAIALADPTCAYVIGQVNGKTVTTPAVPVVVPSSDALAQPIMVHVDQTTQTLLGYSLGLPGASGGTYGSPIFVPGVQENLPSFSFNIPSLPLTTYRCIDFNLATVPAVPVKIPASALQAPGAVADIGGAIFNVTGTPFTVPGQVISFDGKTIFIPEMNAATPAINVGTPNQTITLDINNPASIAKYLPPHN